MYTQRDLRQENKGIITREIPVGRLHSREKTGLAHGHTLDTQPKFLGSSAEFFGPIRLQWEISPKKAGICRKGALEVPSAIFALEGLHEIGKGLQIHRSRGSSAFALQLLTSSGIHRLLSLLPPGSITFNK